MISVLMLTYNREKLVSRAIESILKQTYSDFEFVIVDNGSSDRSGEIAEEYAKKDDRIKVIHREKGTIAAGRNTALDAAKGEYIAFIDDDDFVEFDYLEFLHNLITENNADISICGATGRAFNEKKIMTAEEALIELMWRKKYTMGFPAKLIHHSLIEKEAFPNEVRFDDIAVMYKILANSSITAYHGLLKYNVCRHDNNNSAWTTDHSLLNGKILDEYLNSYKARTEILSKQFPGSAKTFRYFEWSFMISMVEKINRLKLTDCQKQLEYMTAVLARNRDEFLNCSEILSFETEWMEQYVWRQDYELMQ